jgi:hypothetical protein
MLESAVPLPETAPEHSALVTAVVEYEPPSRHVANLSTDRCAAPPALHRHGSRRLRSDPPAVEEPPHQGAAQFADLALRRVLEVVDRRRAPAQLRHLMPSALIDTVAALTRTRHETAATLRRVRLRAAADPTAAEVFATYTRGQRVRAIAARIEFTSGRWQLTALQVG